MPKKLKNGQHTLSELIKAQKDEEVVDEEEEAAEEDNDTEAADDENGDEEAMDDEASDEDDEAMDDDDEASDDEEAMDDDEDAEAFNAGIQHEIKRQNGIREITVPGMEKFMEKLIRDPSCTVEKAMKKQTLYLKKKGGVAKLAKNYSNVKTTRTKDTKISLEKEIGSHIPDHNKKESFTPLGKMLSKK